MASRTGKVAPFWLSLPVCLLVMGGANVATNRLSAANVAIGVAFTLALAGIARASRLRPGDLGLARSTWKRGLRWGCACVGIALAGYGIALLLPPVRSLLAGSATSSWPHTVFTVLVVIPLATVIPEEFAFRGVLWALLRRQWTRNVATAITSVLFGLWHTLPSLAGGPANQAVDQVVGAGTGGMVLRALGTIVFTACAGVLFCELRTRSDSLLAPMLAHWSVNGLGTIFVKLLG
jgi:membrane protease YdiL (CAAX protease family)